MRKNILFVSGASSDIGIAFLKSCCASYDLVYAHYGANRALLEKELRPLWQDRLVPIGADLSSAQETASITAGLEQGMPTHALFLACPRFSLAKFPKIPWEEYDRFWNTSVRSAVQLSQSFLPQMCKEKFGRMVFMLSASVAGAPPAYCTQYVVAKYALLGLMKSLAAEYAGKGICINAVSPATVQTKYFARQSRFFLENSAQASPTGANLLPEELVSTLGWLLSADTMALNGQNILLNYGV